MDSTALRLEHVGHQFNGRTILGDINLTIAVGSIVALVGPSGAGKSTLFKAILGTHPATTGTIYANGQPITSPSRDIGIVYQHYSLFDFLTAEDNVAFGLKLDKTSIPSRLFRPFKWRRTYREFLEKARQYLELVKLPDAAKKYPRQLSGGMRQRVALAQAVVMEPKILLLDEPFGALDEVTREDLQMMLLELHRQNLETQGNLPYTILIVTHELKEALFVADRVIGLSQYHPRGEEIGATIVYDKPSPVWRPLNRADCEGFFEQETEMRRVIFEPGSDNGDGKYIVRTAT